jgi:hypothetical protein
MEGLRPTGHACRVEGALWLEVEVHGMRGWVNHRYARPAAAFHEYVARAVFASGGFRLEKLEEREICTKASVDGYCL